MDKAWIRIIKGIGLASVVVLLLSLLINHMFTNQIIGILGSEKIFFILVVLVCVAVLVYAINNQKHILFFMGNSSKGKSSNKINIKYSVVILLALLVSGCELANTLRLRIANNSLQPLWPTDVTSQQLPLLYLGEKPYVRMRGQTDTGETAELLMLVDTGASITFLFDSEKVQQLHLSKGYRLMLGGWGDQQDSQGYQSQLAELHLGQVRFHDVQIAYLPVSQTPYFARPDELDFDGVLGYDLLRHFSWTFDRAAGLLTVTATPYQPVAADVSLPLQESWRKISIPATVVFNSEQKFQQQLLVDTGSRHYLKLNTAFIEQQKINLPQARVTAADFGLSGRTVHQRVTLPAVQLGELQLNQVKTNLIPSKDEDDWWLLGSALLNQFVMTVDYHSMRLYLRPQEEQAFRSRYNLSGLELRKLTTGDFVIRYLFPELPGVHSGLQEGDVINRINGRSAASYSEADWLVLADTPGSIRLCTVKHCVRLQLSEVVGYSQP